MKYLKFKKYIKSVFFYSIDSFSNDKHKLLKLYYELGIQENKSDLFPFKEVPLIELKKHMNDSKINSFNKILTNSNDITMILNSYRITSEGVANFASEKYLREYHKSIGEYIKTLLQITVFFTTLYFFFFNNNFENKKEIEILKEEIQKLKLNIKIPSPQQKDNQFKKLVNHNVSDTPNKNNKTIKNKFAKTKIIPPKN